MSVSIGFIIILMMVFAAYSAYRTFLTRKMPMLFVSCTQVFVLTIAMIGFVKNVQTSQLVELSYVLFGVGIPGVFLGYDFMKLTEKVRAHGFSIALIPDVICEKRALQLGNKIRKLVSRDYTNFCSMAVEHYNKGEYTEAIMLYKQALERQPDDYKCYYNMAIALDEAGETDEAINALKKTIDLKPEFTEAYNNLSIILSTKGKYLEAVEVYKKALAKNPQDHRIYHNLGITLSEMENYSDAVTAYKKALQLKPEEYEINCYLGAALMELKRYDEAAEAYKKALEFKSSNCEVFYNLSIVYSLLRKHDIAMDNLRRAIHLNKELKYEAMQNSAFDSMRKFDEFNRLVS